MSTKDLLGTVDCEKNKITRHYWEADHNFSYDQKKAVGTESRLISKKIKETIKPYIL